MQKSKWGVQTKQEDKWLWVATASGERYELDSRDEAYSKSYILYEDKWQAQKQHGVKLIRVKQLPSN